MEVYEAIRSRVAVREFKPEPVPEAVIRKILLAARWAPSQRNRQPWHFIVVQEPEMLQRIGELASSGDYIAHAPMAIALVMEAGARNPTFDPARAIENMILTAWAEGIGTSYVQIMDRNKIKELLAIPEEMEMFTVMPYGYPTPAAAVAGKRRKSLDEIAHRERFGQPYA